jgi:tetratricopeptide (TPR) repeat protein
MLLAVFVLSFALVPGVLRAEPASPAELLSAGRTDDAIQLLRARTSSTPGDAEAWNLLGRTYYYMERWDDAIGAAQHAVGLQPGNSDFHLWLARAYGQKAASSSYVTALRLVPKIRGEFEKAVQLNGNNSAARADLAEFYLDAPAFLGGGKDKALAQADQLMAGDPAAAHWIRAQLAQRAKRYSDAESEYVAAIKSSKSPAGRWLDLASFYRDTGHLDLMENAVQKAVAEDPPRSSVPYDAANMLFRAGRDFPRAIELVREYLRSAAQAEEAPAYRAHYLLGSILEHQGNRTAAADEYRTALSLAHDFVQAQAALRRVQ